jgi:VIT1/CCC1 family predicted Fe2+/Mn2+ transporter
VTDGNGVRPPESAEKGLGELVTEVSEKASLLIHEEIELAKSEVKTQLTRLGTGAVVAGAAGVFFVFGLIYFFFALGNWLNEELDFTLWASFGIVWLLLTVLGLIAGLVAYRLFKKGSPPVPKMAIEEAKATREAIEEVRR